MVTNLLLPVFVQVALSFIMMFWTVLARADAAKGDPTLMQRTANDNAKWPDKPRQIANNYNNQFQLPVLFYGVVAFALLTAAENMLLVMLAWIFVLSRFAHTFVHIGPNIVMHRFYAFLVGGLSLIGMWGTLAFHLYF